MELLMLVAAVLAFLVGFIYLYVQHKYAFWANRNVPYIVPKFPFGNINGIGTAISRSQMMLNFYNELKGRGSTFGGIFIYLQPVMLVTDLGFAKSVFIKDFNTFQDRGFYSNEKDDPLSAHLFALNGNKWKRLRSKLTPTFTSGKMKFMFPTIVEVAEQFQQSLAHELCGSEIIEMKELLARYTTDIIGTCAFGIKCNSLKDPNAKFRLMGKKTFEQPRNSQAVRFFVNEYKALAQIMRLKVTPSDVSEFFLGIVNETIEYREKNQIKRNDFMDILIDLKNEENDGLSINEIAAQAFLFFLGGFETSSTTMSFCLHELAANLDIQQKVRDEIKVVLAKHNGNITYESLTEMQYLGNVISETLRFYPPFSVLKRRTILDYTAPGTNITVPKDTTVFIPVHALQHDAAYYPDPERFNPDRFSADSSGNPSSVIHMAFGDGPRNCFGLRFAIMQIKVGIITLLKNFQFNICSESNVPLVISKKYVITTSEGGLHLKVNKIEE